MQCGSFTCLGFQNTGDLCQPNRGVFREGRHVGLRELLPTAELQDDDRNFGVVRFEPKNHRSPNRMRSGERSEEHTSELQSPDHLVCRLLLEKKKTKHSTITLLS